MCRTRLAFGFITLISLSALTVVCNASAAISTRTTSSEIEAGRYLVRAGDCVNCHTNTGGKLFAGGLAVHTPFGIVYAPNITPDKETGIGNWSKQDFYNAMHLGKDNRGKYLYPAFPYPWYTIISRSDVDAMKAYLDTLTPVKQKNTPNTLNWPISWRYSMVAWNTLYFTAGSFKPDTKKSAQYNRGAYLVEGVGHCSQCHSPKNMLGAVKTGAKQFTGGYADPRAHWFAPNLSGNVRQGIGGWSIAEIVEYLKTGKNAKSAAVGPMSGVVMYSTRFLSDADLTAIAVYLKDMPQQKTTIASETTVLSHQAFVRGRTVYMSNCAGCHMQHGGGFPHYFPSLKGSATIQAANPGTVIHVVLAGASLTAPSSKPTGLVMPAFDQKLSNQEIADVVNYIRNAWGNHAPLTNADTVSNIRKIVEPSAVVKHHKQEDSH